MATHGIGATGAHGGDAGLECDAPATGFRMTARSAQTLPARPSGDHLVLPTGLARLGVREPQRREHADQPACPNPPRGLIFRLLDRVDGHKITAVARSARHGTIIASQLKAKNCPRSAHGGTDAMAAPRLTLVQRTTARCCDEMLAQLQPSAGLSRFPAELLDVDSDPQLRRRHGLDVRYCYRGAVVVSPPGRGELRAGCCVRAATRAPERSEQSRGKLPYNPPAAG